MSNRVYLVCTQFSTIPRENEFGVFAQQTGVEYEAVACIPMFWFCLFSQDDVNVLPADHNGFEDDSRPYAYLCCPRDAGLTRLRALSSLMENALGERRYALYLEWIDRLEREPYEYVLVRTEELDWMGEDGELEVLLRKALKHMDKNVIDGEMRLSNAMREVVGFWGSEELFESESYELVGTANSKPSWPERFTPLPTSAEPIKEKRVWWKIWKKAK